MDERAAVQHLASKLPSRDRRSPLRKGLDANRYRVQELFAKTRSYQELADALRHEGITDPAAPSVDRDTLRITLKRTGILTDQPDPKAPSEKQWTSGFKPVGGRLEPSERGDQPRKPASRLLTL